MKEVENILSKAAECFQNARGSLLKGAGYLHVIYRDKLYDGAYTTFGEYVEQECQISPGYASKLIKSYEYYVIQGGVSQRKLEAVDPEKLYMAIALHGNVEQKLVKAEQWTRQEIKDQLASTPDGDCKHKVLIPHYQCANKKCGKWVKV